MPLASVKLKDDDDQVNVEPSAVSGISAFLGKLWKMVEDSKTDHLISWGKSGNTFVIKNQIDFAKTILPNYYKHNNIASFIRQLNMYGFHKIISTTSGALDSNDNDEIEFTHPCFVRGHPYLLEQIKRKMNNPKENFIKSEGSNQFNESIKSVLNDIKNLKGKQEYLGNQLCAVKQENEILWRELSLLRQKHAAQNSILNKLIRFLVSLAQPSSNHSLVKRRLVPLMLKDADSNMKPTTPVYEGDHVYTVKKKEETSHGPTIHEIQSSDLSENIQIIETPVMEVSVDDTPIMIENEVTSSPSSNTSNCEVGVVSPEPVPAALLLPNKKGQKKIRTVYLTPAQQIPSHILIPHCITSEQNSPEYLVPERTDNPYMELIHDTESEDNNDYITIVTNEGDDNLEDGIPVTLVSKNPSKSSTNKTSFRRRNLGRKKMKKEIPTNLNVKLAVPKKTEKKKKAPTPTILKENTNTVSSDDFLFDIGLTNEPMIEIETPLSNVTPQIEQIPKVLSTSGNSNEKDEIPLCVEDIINVPHATSNIDSSNSSVTNEILLSSDTIGQSTLIENTENDLNLTDTDKLNISDKVSDSNDMRKCINECIDNAKNMKIACPETSVAPTKSYVDDISMQLDSVESEINSIKERIENGGLTSLQNEGLIPLDMMNTLIDQIFNQDPLNYNIPVDSSEHFSKLQDTKMEGNELISSTPPIFDLTDMFPQSDWSTPSTSISPLDTDYCALNTPQIEERNMEESQSGQPPPFKKIKNTTSTN